MDDLHSESAWISCLQSGVTGEDAVVDVAVQHRDIRPNCDSGNQAVDHLPNSLTIPPTLSVEGGCCFIIGGLGGQNRRASEKSAEIAEMSFVPRTGKQLHPHGIARRDLGPEELIHSSADGASRVSQELDPG